MATARPRKRGPLKGRSLVAIGLLAFVAVTSLVIWRRSVGYATAKAMQQANAEKRALESEKTTLGNQLRDARSRRFVVAEAERRLGLHVATESETRVIAESGKSP